MEEIDERVVAKVGMSKEWQRMEEVMINGLERTRDALELAVDPPEFYRLQGEVRSVRSIISEVRSIKKKIKEKEEANEN